MDDKYLSFKKRLKELIKELRSFFEKNDIYSKLENHNKQMLDANFWQDKANSSKVIKEKKFYEELTNSFENSIKSLDDLNDLYKLAKEENNQNIQSEVFENIKELRSLVKKMK